MLQRFKMMIIISWFIASHIHTTAWEYKDRSLRMKFLLLRRHRLPEILTLKIWTIYKWHPRRLTLCDHKGKPFEHLSDTNLFKHPHLCTPAQQSDICAFAHYLGFAKRNHKITIGYILQHKTLTTMSKKYILRHNEKTDWLKFKPLPYKKTKYTQGF